MKRFKLSIIYIATLPIDVLVAWPMVLLVRLFFGKDLRWSRGVLSCEFRAGSFPLTPGRWPKGFYLVNRVAARDGEAPRSWGGTSIGHGMLFRPDGRSKKGAALDQLSRTEVHESHHTKQARAGQVGSFLFGIVFMIHAAIAGGSLWPALLVWSLGGALSVSVGGWLEAWLSSDERGVYRGSCHEVGAYAVGDLYAIKKSMKK